MNPYDRRAVREVWARVRPGQDVFAPPGPPRPGQGGKPPGHGPWPPPPPPPPSPPPEALSAADALVSLAAGYEFLSRRIPWLRRLAAQCRRGEQALASCAGVQGREIPNTRADICAQRRSEQALRDSLDRLDGPCRGTAARLRRESAARTRAIARLR